MSFEVPTLSLHVHERIDPRTLLEAVCKKNGNNYEQLSLFSSKTENPPLREAIEFYKHAHGLRRYAKLTRYVVHYIMGLMLSSGLC
jgi:hypothetical protein